MGEYGNGVSTRKNILLVCRKLFLEKGFHETSYDDISQAAHVNRGSIYYHFKEKENIRYEVLWEQTTENRRFVETICDRREFVNLLAIYMSWHWFLTDPKFRKFHMDYILDCPVYSPNHGLGLYYSTLFKQTYGPILPDRKVTPLAFASVYGHFMGLMQMCAEHPDSYTATELFYHCHKAGNLVWGASLSEIEASWQQLLPYIDAIDAKLQTD